MTRLKRNVISNYAAMVWSTIMGLAFIPIYLRVLGAEGYGLVGVYTVLLGMSKIFDLGIGSTLNRELSRLSASEEGCKERKGFIWTLEVVYLIIALLIGLLILILAPYIATEWVTADRLSYGEITDSIRLMGCIAFFAWMNSFYSGGILGLQRQVGLNAITIIMSTLRSGGSALILLFVSPTILAYFIWQLLVSTLQAGVAAWFLWRNVGGRGGGEVAFDINHVIRVWKFSAGVSITMILAIIMTQLDKIILSKMLNMEAFGYYTVATVVALKFKQLYSPLIRGLYPKLSSLVALGDKKGAVLLYHKASQIICVLTIPLAIVFLYFSYEIMQLWTGSKIVAENASVVASLLIAATALNGLMQVPYYAQLAHGWTRLGVVSNIMSVIVIVPLLLFFIDKYGAVGASISLIILNSGYIILSVQVMHRKIFRGEKKKWYLIDIGLPLLVSILIATACYELYILFDIEGKYILLVVGGAAIAAMFCAAMAAPYTREVFMKIISWKRGDELR